MKFKFKIQQYQTDAVEQTVNVFAGQPSKTNAQYRRDLGKRKGQITFEEEYVGWRNSDVELQGHQLATIYQTTQDNVSMHISNIYEDKELDKEGTRKKFFLVRQDGKRQVQREIDHYNLDMIIALGYRVQSPIAVRFRRWAPAPESRFPRPDGR